MKTWWTKNATLNAHEILELRSLATDMLEAIVEMRNILEHQKQTKHKFDEIINKIIESESYEK